MAEHSRYNADKNNTDPHFPNKYGLFDLKAIEEAEALLLEDSYDYFLDKLHKGNLVLNSDLIIQIHRHFFEALYSWAGKFRNVDISKNGVMFASCRFIPDLLKDFDRQLKEHLPTTDDPKKEVAVKMAYIHNELNAIHPFREGNGRTLRLFLDLIAASCGYQPIEYPSNKTYFDACGSGMMGDNVPMERVMLKGMKKT